ncbi:hypothetical protein BV898_19698 [Hypsibius exemplaris]|uniref:Uncharacterized protein n=1 Tax=Hypsibius exemplaris TaxID=2072580 RepID=A0A9X6NJR5_HYPEX|nr:hypothetical protein BV898_19698 [Hypsibius exemplaris]
MFLTLSRDRFWGDFLEDGARGMPEGLLRTFRSVASVDLSPSASVSPNIGRLHSLMDISPSDRSCNIAQHSTSPTQYRRGHNRGIRVR